MKVSIIGVGNVGGLLASRLLELQVPQITLIDAFRELAEAKALDLEDACALYKYNCNLKGSQNFEDIAGSDIVVITAGFARRPGMSREELLKKNALIIKEIALKIKELCSDCLILVVTNPLDVITYLVLKTTGFPYQRIIGVGANLDAARFTNLISKQLNISSQEIDALVIGSHGEAMLPLARFTYIKGKPLTEIVDTITIEKLIQATIKRGAQIVSLYGSGSAYFAPSLAIAKVIAGILQDQKKTMGVCAYLQGEYGLSDLCIGVPCILGKNGIEDIVELPLNDKERELFLISAQSIRLQIENLKQNALL